MRHGQASSARPTQELVGTPAISGDESVQETESASSLPRGNPRRSSRNLFTKAEVGTDGAAAGVDVFLEAFDIPISSVTTARRAFKTC